MLAGPGEAFRSASSGGEGFGEGRPFEGGRRVRRTEGSDSLRRARARQPDRQGGLVRKAAASRAFPFPPPSAASPMIVSSTSSRSTARSSPGSRSTTCASDLFIRGALEGEIAAEAARRMTRADKDALAANLKQEAAAVARRGSGDVLRARRGVPPDIDRSLGHGASRRCPRVAARPSGKNASG